MPDKEEPLDAEGIPEPKKKEVRVGKLTFRQKKDSGLDTGIDDPIDAPHERGGGPTRR